MAQCAIHLLATLWRPELRLRGRMYPADMLVHLAKVAPRGLDNASQLARGQWRASVPASRVQEMTMK